MSALTRWRRKVNEKGLSKAEKEKDLRRHSNQEAFEEFKAQRAEQQRKRRRRTAKNKTNERKTHSTYVQFIQVEDGVEVFYVDLDYLNRKGHKVKNKVYAEKSAKKLMATLVEKSRKKKNFKRMSDFDVLYKTMSKKKRAYGHASDKEYNKVYTTVVLNNIM